MVKFHLNQKVTTEPTLANLWKWDRFGLSSLPVAPAVSLGTNLTLHF